MRKDSPAKYGLGLWVIIAPPASSITAKRANKQKGPAFQKKDHLNKSFLYLQEIADCASDFSTEALAVGGFLLLIALYDEQCWVY
jgi:hypothetical protein